MTVCVRDVLEPFIEPSIATSTSKKGEGTSLQSNSKIKEFEESTMIVGLSARASKIQ